MKTISAVLLVVCLCLLGVYGQITIQNGINAPDVPGFTPNLKTIPAGSLIIPMDPYLQITVPKAGIMSILPYGLVIRSLYSNITLNWAINTGKPLSGIDFTAVTANALFSSVQVNGLQAFSTPKQNSFLGGPFIIPQQNVAKALKAWNTWRTNPSVEFKTVDSHVYDNLQIHLLSQSVLVDVRHTLSARPFVAVSNLDGNAPTQTALLGCIYQNTTRACPRQGGYGGGDQFGAGAAGCTAFSPQDHAGLEWGRHYAVYDCGAQVAALTDTTCLATFSEPHWDWDSASGPSYINALIKFINGGANFIAQCASTQSYENSAGTSGQGTFLTNYGIGSLYSPTGINTGNTPGVNGYKLNTITNYPDLPVLQYVGPITSQNSGQVTDFWNYFGSPDTTPSSFTPKPNNYDTSSQSYINFKSNAFPLVTNNYDTTISGNYNKQGRNIYIAAGVKLNQGKVHGANIVYLGGHTWGGNSDTGYDNGRRLFLNAIMIPADRPLSCGFSFCTPGQQGDPIDYCTPTFCDASGTTFIPTPSQDCCTQDTNCTAPCTSCNTNSHKCQLIPGCCSPGSVTCTTACTECSQVNPQTNLGICTGTTGCCTADSACQGNVTSACIHCVQKACVRTSAPECCDKAADCTDTCYTCGTTNTCVRQPGATCCLADADCGNICSACNLATNKCYAKVGCCNTLADCQSTSPCVACSNNTCVRNANCCENDAQCGTCKSCSPTTHTCGPSSDKSCCTTDSDCPQCTKCFQGAGGAKTCLPIPSCCISNGDCETCEFCSASVCTRYPTSGNNSCCRFDSDCTGCDVCDNFKCTPGNDLSCCQTNDDCTYARKLLLDNANITHSNISDCDLQCALTTGGSGTGQCQAVCTTPKSYTGLIVGLAVGIPLCLAALAALAAIVAIIIYKKRDALQAKFVAKDKNMGAPALHNPLHEQKIQVHHAPQGL